MKYYNFKEGKIELTDEGKKALDILGISSLAELTIYPDKQLNEDYWDDCKTYVEQALKNGKGITYLGDCKIPYQSEEDKATATPQGKCTSGLAGHITEPVTDGKGRQDFERPKQNGRFPANLLVSDDVLQDGQVHASGEMKAGTKRKNREGYSGDMPEKTLHETIGDSGSFSRFFSLDAWWEKKLKELPPEVRKTFPFLIVPKASTSEKNEGIEDGTGVTTYNRKCLKCGKWERNQGIDPVKYTCSCEKPEWQEPKGNIHPTVKPLALFSWLITISSREGDVVLDPFIGSGTTAVAARMLGRKFIGIDTSSEYLEIAKARLKQGFLL